jgi:hypothetical protein
MSNIFSLGKNGLKLKSFFKEEVFVLLKIDDTLIWLIFIKEIQNNFQSFIIENKIILK